ncbi:MAG: 30S ribosomal protein S17 [Candidatus Gracilibacteria bacterium]|nr:30S ribosomal protein S17 [bacterium]MDZ4217059.1 30S ribosomal protein S17 [Candidatus Gracilibacteria bacterium]
MRTITGTVSSTKMANTVVVTVHKYKRHPKYEKQYRQTKKFYAHDENNTCQEGDTVTIAEHPPISKLKRWKVTEINGTPIDSLQKTKQKAENQPATPEVKEPETETLNALARAKSKA